MKLLSYANMSKIRAMLLNAMPEKPGLVFAIYRHMTGINYPISRNPEPMWETLMNNPKIYGPIMKKIVWVMCDSLSPFDYGQGIESNPAFKFVQGNSDKDPNYYFKWDRIALQAVRTVIENFVAENAMEIYKKEIMKQK